MGVFEAAVTPYVFSSPEEEYVADGGTLSGLTLMTGFWYTRREIPLRQCIWYSSLGWGGIVSNLL